MFRRLSLVRTLRDWAFFSEAIFSSRFSFVGKNRYLFRNRKIMTEGRNAKIGQIEIIDNDLILQSLSEGVCVIDASRKLAFANHSAAKLLDFQNDDLIGKNYDIVFFRHDKSLSEDELAICPIQFALTEGAASHINTETFFRSDGSTFLVEYVCSPIFEENEIAGAVVTFQDITERRDIEAALSEVRELALESARTKAAFLANMSHEIRTPLSGVVGTANLLLDTDLTAEQRKYLQMLRKSVDSLMETVNDILDFSKIEAGKLALETIEFNLRELLEETANLFKISANRKNLSLNFTVENGVSEIFRGDANRLRQVLNNLLSNAVKFTETGEIRLKISNSEETKSHTVLLFEVFDTGIGIDEEQKGRLFQPFTQADISTTRRFGGTGLGLAICREIVEMMQGEIGLESEIGKGSRFWFTVLLVQSPKSKVQSLKTQIDTETFGRNDKKGLRTRNLELGTLKILIVEDDEVNREITSKLLEQIGYNSEFAENGAEAVKKTGEKDFDLILMDCQMPEMDGFAAAQMIRRREKSPHSKIIALTAFSAEAEREKCLRSGMNDYLCKPVTKKDLVEILQKHFSAEKVSPNLDLEENFVQHSLSEIIIPEILNSFLAIESRGEKNFVSEILQIYCENAEKQISALKTDIQNRDAESIGRRAHSLKGSSANVGLEKLTALFEDLQLQANTENWERIENLITEIIEKIEFIKKRIHYR